VLIGFADDPDSQAWVAGFRQGLEKRGWLPDRNVRIDYRFAAGQADRFSVLAKELIALQPNVILSQGTSVTAAAQQETRTVPIVFVNVSDPIGSGFVPSWRGRAAILPACCSTRRASRASGCRCSRRSRRSLSASRSSPIPR
jgi:putative tryptophan/tyrosine transport system substrate-binding protein